MSFHAVVRRDAQDVSVRKAPDVPTRRCREPGPGRLADPPVGRMDSMTRIAWSTRLSSLGVPGMFPGRMRGGMCSVPGPRCLSQVVHPHPPDRRSDVQSGTTAHGEPSFKDIDPMRWMNLWGGSPGPSDGLRRTSSVLSLGRMGFTRSLAGLGFIARPGAACCHAARRNTRAPAHRARSPSTPVHASEGVGSGLPGDGEPANRRGQAVGHP